MVDGGSINMNGSMASVKGFASKAAIRSFARTWTVDLKARKIHVNVLSPGTIDTGIFEGVADAKDAFVAMIPRGTIGRPKEIATAALSPARRDDASASAAAP